MSDILFSCLWMAGCTCFAYAAMSGIEWLVTGGRKTPKALPADPTPELSLDETFAALRRAAGPKFIDPLREQLIIHTSPVTVEEAKIVYAEHVRTENRLRRARLRRERWAAFRAKVREFRTLVLESLKSFILLGD